jgi:hypothetical protein
MFHVFVQDLAREYTATTWVGQIGFAGQITFQSTFLLYLWPNPKVHDYYKIPEVTHRYD